MDEIRAEVNHGAVPAEQTEPREVVLQYVPQAQGVTEYYVQPTPYPGRTPEEEDGGEDEPPRRRHRWPWVLLACLVLLAGLGALGAYLYARLGAADPLQSETRYRYEWTDHSGEETKIARYPNGDGVRLHFSETHGEALTIQEVYRRVNPSTVTVVTAMGDGSALVGTGVIFTADGYILTNAHVLSGGRRCAVFLTTGERFTARLLGMDEVQDLAVIKIEAADLPVAEFGDSDALTVGDTVYAIGNPLGVELTGTLTDGIVSAINRDVLVDGVMMTLIQTNAALNNGNSGGPLINIYGQVVGINTMKMGSTSSTSVEGLGFAIPVSSTAYMVGDLIAYGEVRGEPVLGVTVSSQGVAGPEGGDALLVLGLTPGGPGERAGIRTDDFILAADGEAVHSSTDLLRIRRRYGVGDTLRLTLWRAGTGRYEAEVVLAEARD